MMVGESPCSSGSPPALDVEASSGALTLFAAFPLMPPRKSHLPSLLQNALLPGPFTVNVDSVKEEIATPAWAAPAPAMNAIAVVTATASNLREKTGTNDSN
jgi:hypothetical protein